jgi:hypothetical protein
MPLAAPAATLGFEMNGKNFLPLFLHRCLPFWFFLPSFKISRLPCFHFFFLFPTLNYLLNYFLLFLSQIRVVHQRMCLPVQRQVR